MRIATIALVGLATLLAACGGGGSSTVTVTVPGTTGTTSSASPKSITKPTGGATTVPPTTAQSADQTVLGVINGNALALYAVAAGSREAHLLRDLDPPTKGLQPIDVGLSAGNDPVVCAIWGSASDQFSKPRYLECYDRGASSGRHIGVTRELGSAVAVRSDGQRVAWSENDRANKDTPALATAALDGDRVGRPRRWPAAAPIESTTLSESQGVAIFAGIASLAWAGTSNRLIISASLQDTEGSGIAMLDTEGLAHFWIPDRGLVTAPKRYERVGLVFGGVKSATSSSALALTFSQEASGREGLRIDERSGRVLDTVAMANPGRTLNEVSGAGAVIVYSTSAVPGEGRRDYIRYPADTVGGLLTGLPSSTAYVVAA